MTESLQTFQKSNGKTSELGLILRRAKLKGRAGVEGEKYVAQVNMTNGTKSRKAGTYFVKDSLSHRDIALHPEAHPEKQLMKWRILRKLGLPVVPTFRIDREKNQILMTDATQGGKYLIFSSNRRMTLGQFKKFQKVNSSKLESIKADLKAMVKLAYEGVQLDTDTFKTGVALNYDSFAIKVDKNTFEAELLFLDLGWYVRLLVRNDHEQYDFESSGARGDIDLFIGDFIDSYYDPSWNSYWPG